MSSDLNANSTVLPHENANSLSGNAASYQSGGKKLRRGNKKTIKRTHKGKKRSNTKKCWWKFW